MTVGLDPVWSLLKNGLRPDQDGEEAPEMHTKCGKMWKPSQATESSQIKANQTKVSLSQAQAEPKPSPAQEAPRGGRALGCGLLSRGLDPGWPRLLQGLPQKGEPITKKNALQNNYLGVSREFLATTEFTSHQSGIQG